MTMMTTTITITTASYILRRLKACDLIWHLFFPLQSFSESLSKRFSFFLVSERIKGFHIFATVVATYDFNSFYSQSPQDLPLPVSFSIDLLFPA